MSPPHHIFLGGGYNSLESGLPSELVSRIGEIRGGLKSLSCGRQLRCCLKTYTEAYPGKWSGKCNRASYLAVQHEGAGTRAYQRKALGHRWLVPRLRASDKTRVNCEHENWLLPLIKCYLTGGYAAFELSGGPLVLQDHIPTLRESGPPMQLVH